MRNNSKKSIVWWNWLELLPETISVCLMVSIRPCNLLLNSTERSHIVWFWKFFDIWYNWHCFQSKKQQHSKIASSCGSLTTVAGSLQNSLWNFGALSEAGKPIYMAGWHKTKNYRLYSLSLPAFTLLPCTVSSVHEKFLMEVQTAVFKATVKFFLLVLLFLWVLRGRFWGFFSSKDVKSDIWENKCTLTSCWFWWQYLQCRCPCPLQMSPQ